MQSRCKDCEKTVYVLTILLFKFRGVTRLMRLKIFRDWILGDFKHVFVEEFSRKHGGKWTACWFIFFKWLAYLLCGMRLGRGMFRQHSFLYRCKWKIYQWGGGHYRINYNYHHLSNFRIGDRALFASLEILHDQIVWKTKPFNILDRMTFWGVILG